MKTIRWMILILGVVMTVRAEAGIISGETASANIAPFLPLRGAQHAVDNSGLSAGDNSALTADQTHSTTTDNDMWLGTSGNPNPIFTVDLGLVYPSVVGVRIFNYNEGNAQPALHGVKDTYILQSLDGVTYTTNSLGLLTLAPASGLASETGVYYAFNEPVAARYFQLSMLSTYSPNGFYGLSELQFEAVPEPSIVLLLGLGGWLLLRRRFRE